MDGLDSKDEKRRKIAAVAYLIDAFHIRVGDEEETEAGTVGATSLRKEHIKLHPNPPSVELDFLGKDSIRFNRTLNVSPEAYENLKSFAANGSQLFEGVRSDDVREFLSEVMPKLSPKVFRTYHATRLFQRELQASTIKPTSGDASKKLALIKANAVVAQLMNHQRTPPKSWKDVYEKRLSTLQSLQGKDTKSAQKRRRGLKLRLEEMRMSKTWNLGTSLRNYIDPRVTVSFCDQVHYDWKAYYPKSLVGKFSWAANNSNEGGTVNEAPANSKTKRSERPPKADKKALST
jgi:DNA topoisomerase-1